MKYHNLLSFEKHLQESLPYHPSPIYLIITGCSFERAQMAKKIFSLLNRDDALFHTVTSLDSLLEDLNTPSLFTKITVTYLDEIQTLKSLTQLTHYVTHPNPTSFLILGSTSMKPLADLYQKGKKEMVVLDLSEEKPWDKERRLQSWLIAQAKSQNKSLSSETASFLTEKIGSNMPALAQELEKLICFAGERTSLSLSDAQTLASSLADVNSWQLAEKVIWQKDARFIHDKLTDLSFFLLFIGQLRYQLQIGYKISSLLDKNIPLPDIKNKLPQIRSLDKYLPSIKERKSAYFYRGLLSLYQMELQAKSTNLAPSTLFDHFLGSLYR